MVGRIYVGTTKHCNIVNKICELKIMVLEKIFKFSPHRKSMGANDTWGILAKINDTGLSYCQTFDTT